MSFVFFLHTSNVLLSSFPVCNQWNVLLKLVNVQRKNTPELMNDGIWCELIVCALHRPYGSCAASYQDVSLSMKMCAQRKAEKGTMGLACSLYPSHGPLRFITSHSRSALASTMRKTKVPEEEAGSCGQSHLNFMLF